MAFNGIFILVVGIVFGAGAFYGLVHATLVTLNGATEKLEQLHQKTEAALEKNKEEHQAICERVKGVEVVTELFKDNQREHGLLAERVARIGG